MVRCVCKTTKGTQCKKTAEEGSKTCFLHKKCKSKTKKPRKALPKAKGKKTTPRAWVKSKLWEDSPIPDWMKGGDKIKTKAMTPQNADPWWLR